MKLLKSLIAISALLTMGIATSSEFSKSLKADIQSDNALLDLKNNIQLNIAAIEKKQPSLQDVFSFIESYNKADELINKIYTYTLFAPIWQAVYAVKEYLDLTKPLHEGLTRYTVQPVNYFNKWVAQHSSEINNAVNQIEPLLGYLK